MCIKMNDLRIKNKNVIIIIMISVINSFNLYFFLNLYFNSYSRNKDIFLEHECDFFIVCFQA